MDRNRFRIREEEGSREWFGGRQQWMEAPWARAGACATVVAAHQLIALGERAGIPVPVRLPEFRQEFAGFLNRLVRHVYPFYFFRHRSLTLGIFSVSRYARLVGRAAGIHGLKIRPVWIRQQGMFRNSRGRVSPQETASYIRQALDYGCPPALLLGFNRHLARIPMGGRTWNLQRHWVTVTDLRTASGRTLLEVSSWGYRFELDLDDCWRGLLPGVLYFRLEEGQIDQIQ